MRWRMLLAVLLSLGAGGRGLFEQGKRPLQGVRPPPGLSLSVASCAACHPDQAEQWRRSWHARASTDPVFVASVRGARGEPWCRNCHSPLPEQQDAIDALPEGLAAEGINCAVCHIRDGAVLTARPPPDDPQGPHPLRYTPALSASSFCGGCHQFPIPRTDDLPKVHYTRIPMQDTLSEWQQTDTAPCQGCHMPQKSHTFPGAHDQQWLAETLSVTVREVQREPGADVRLPAFRAEAVLASVGAGHRIPTGDPFRQLLLEICADPDCASVIGASAAVRHFVGDKQWREGPDRSIPPPAPGSVRAERTLRLMLGSPPPWYYRLTYLYAEERLMNELPPEEIGFLLASGEVVPLTAP